MRGYFFTALIGLTALASSAHHIEIFEANKTYTINNHLDSRIDFLGKITLDPDSIFGGPAALSTYQTDVNGPHLDATLCPDLNTFFIDFVDQKGPSEYVGILFSVDVPGSSAPGLYQWTEKGSPNLSSFVIGNGVGDPMTEEIYATAPYSIKISGNQGGGTEATPEPITSALGVFGVAAFLRRRRRAK